MSVLILHRASLAANPYPRWLSDYPGELLLLASQEKLNTFGETLPGPGAGYAHAEAFEGYDTSSRLIRTALELARRHRVRHVVATAEFDLERAAALRSLLGLPGQDPDSAAAFRDKFLMKARLRAAGVAVAADRDVRTAVDLLGFPSYPLVVKPRNGAAGFGTRVIADRDELRRQLPELAIYGAYQPNLMVEEFVEGDFYHVDGIVAGGKVVLSWPSRYLGSILPGRHTAPSGDVQLDASDPLTARLLAFTDEVLQAMPTPEVCTFHAEVFHTPGDELVLCEIASRTGGAKVKHILQATFGVDVNAYWLRAQVGLPVPELDRPEPARIGGSLLFPPRPGTLVSVPAGLDLPTLVEYDLLARPGRRLRDTTITTDYLAAVVLTGRDGADCRRWLDHAHELFEQGTVIAP